MGTSRALPMLVVGLTLLLTSCEGSGGHKPDGLPDRQAEAAARQSHAAAEIACLESFGLTVERSRDGRSFTVIGSGKDAAAESAYLEAEARCGDIVGGAPTPEPLREAEIRRLYELQLEAAECLREHGLKPADPPSVEVFIATYRNMTDAPWSPYDVVRDPETLSVCPQPDISSLWDE